MDTLGNMLAGAGEGWDLSGATEDKWTHWQDNINKVHMPMPTHTHIPTYHTYPHTP